MSEFDRISDNISRVVSDVTGSVEGATSSVTRWTTDTLGGAFRDARQVFAGAELGTIFSGTGGLLGGDGLLGFITTPLLWIVGIILLIIFLPMIIGAFKK